MDPLEEAFVAYLNVEIQNQETVEIRIKWLRDSLLRKFISDDYPASKITAELTSLVNLYRREKRVLVRTGSGRYLYDPKGTLTEELDDSFSFSRAVAERDFDIASRVPTPATFETLSELLDSRDVLVMRNLNSIDFSEFEGLSF